MVLKLANYFWHLMFEHPVGEEMLNRVLPKLSKVEKQELYDLQDRYKP